MAKKKLTVAGATPATVALAKLDIPFEVRAYEHDPSVQEFGQEAARVLGVPSERVFKTLLVAADSNLVVGIVPVSGFLDLKAIANVVGARKAVMAEPSLAERKTGYVVGGISPVGQRTKFPTVLDESAFLFDTVLVSGGRRGLDIELSAAHLQRATEATVADISRS